MNILRLMIVGALLLFHITVNAGQSQGLVSSIYVHEPGILLFGAGNITNTPACNRSNQWAISLSDTFGKSMYAALLSAQAQNKQVIVYGYSNTCSAWGDRELPSYIVIQ